MKFFCLFVTWLAVLAVTQAKVDTSRFIGHDIHPGLPDDTSYICTKKGSSIAADPVNRCQFFQCENGKPVKHWICPLLMKFNPKTSSCDLHLHPQETCSGIKWVTDPSTGKQYTVVPPEAGKGIDIQRSKKTCEYYNAILPEPRTEEENKFVAGLKDDMFFLGVNDLDQDGVWTYNSDNSPVTWLTSKPESQEIFVHTGMYRKSRGCGLMWNRNFVSDELKPEIWMDSPCSFYKKFYIFEDVVCQSVVEKTIAKKPKAAPASTGEKLLNALEQFFKEIVY